MKKSKISVKISSQKSSYPIPQVSIKHLEPISIIMRCFYLKAILLLHRPFIGRSKENPQFKCSRERAVQAALLIVRNSIHLFTSSNVLLENHFAAYPMLAHGLFPAPVALALDLYTYPDQPNPEPNRQALLDMRRVYLQLSTQFVPMKRLYKILNVLMGKAWEKAGLILPVEEISSRMASFSSTQSTPSPTSGQLRQRTEMGTSRCRSYLVTAIFPNRSVFERQFRLDCSTGIGSGEFNADGRSDARIH